VTALAALVLRDPAFLLLAAAAPIALLLRRRGRPATLPLATLPHLVAAVGPRGGRTLRTRLAALPAVLAALAIVLLAVAAARPAERSAAPLVREGIDVLLCLDVSSSMETADLDRGRTRLAVAKEAADRFVAARETDRIGLVTFARFPEVRCPATLDHDALRRILASVATVASDGPEDATGIGTAVARAAQALSEAGGASKVVVLLTDGEENVATEQAPGEIPPAHAAQWAERLGVRVHAIVAGGGRRAPGGGTIRPDSRAIEKLARRTGGEFHEAPTAAALSAVYDTIDALERTRFEEPRSVFRDRFLPFLVAALLLAAVGRLLAAGPLEVLP
jgi:Ca-activated chloride channel family protein